MNHSHSKLALLATICFLGIACSEVPTDPTAALVAPEFAKGEKGKPPKYDWVALSISLPDIGTAGVTSDVNEPYEHDECGVRAAFPPNPGGDLLLGTDTRPLRKKEADKCGGKDGRWITVDLSVPANDNTDPGGIIEGDHYLNVDNVQSLTVEDGTVERRASLLVRGGDCTLVFDPFDFPGSDWVQVRKNVDGTWTVETQAPHVAYCKDGVRGYHLPFGLTAILKED